YLSPRFHLIQYLLHLKHLLSYSLPLFSLSSLYYSSSELSTGISKLSTDSMELSTGSSSFFPVDTPCSGVMYSISSLSILSPPKPYALAFYLSLTSHTYAQYYHH